MKLTAIVEQIPNVLAAPKGDAEITGVVCDSRAAQAGSLFVAVRGVKADGHDYLESAARAGSSACVVEKRDAETFGMQKIVVEDAECALGWASTALWGHPSRALTLVGITGTNGKTTVSYMVQHLLTSAGVVTGRLGTVDYDYPTGSEPAPLTTPDAPKLQEALSRMVSEGAGAAVAEISSHALSRKRVEGCSFACAVFTNLSQDHLDYHGTMRDYFEAKKLLFTAHPRIVEAVVNVDDPWGVELAAELGGPVVTFGLNGGDVRVEVLEQTSGTIRATLHFPGGSAPLSIPTTGTFNASNAAAALATGWALGLDIRSAAKALGKLPQIPGRLEALQNDHGLGAYVDFAHTPDALERVLETVRQITEGRLICVFGCGGDRDRTKRPLMGKAAGKHCDIVVVTADNSRSEETGRIMDDIQAGFKGDRLQVEPRAGRLTENCYTRQRDRREAIRLAVAAAKPGDCLVIAGKGHETTMTAGGRVTHFDDREELALALALPLPEKDAG